MKGSILLKIVAYEKGTKPDIKQKDSKNDCHKIVISLESLPNFGEGFDPIDDLMFAPLASLLQIGSDGENDSWNCDFAFDAIDKKEIPSVVVCEMKDKQWEHRDKLILYLKNYFEHDFFDEEYTVICE